MGFGYDVEEKVADIPIAGVVVHELEKKGDVDASCGRDR
jgi:hypothetical protein